jgi:adenine-specific DNA methylase
MLSAESRERFEKARQKPALFGDAVQLRGALLDFIADFADWDNSTAPEFLDTSRSLTQAAHEALGGTPGTKPLVVDPFAGGGSIPLEALRVGADAFASDLNPVAVLLSKVVLEYIPKYGLRLADEVRRWGEWIEREAVKELAQFYPKDSDGAVPIAYLWARTIRCEGPGCGAEVPLIRSLWLSKKAKRPVALQLVPSPRKRRVDLQIIVKHRGGWVDQSDPRTKIKEPRLDGTVKRGAASCPCCGYTTAAENTRKQFIPRAGGADDARLLAVVVRGPGAGAVRFRLGSKEDLRGLQQAAIRVASMETANKASMSVVPDETLPYLRSIFNINLLGVNTWGKLFNRRQALALATLVEMTRSAAERLSDAGDPGLARATATCLACAVDRCADYWSSLAVWAGDFVAHTFGRQALGIIWDYAEVNGLADGSGNYSGAVDWIIRVIRRVSDGVSSTATVEQASACQHPLPSDSGQAFVTDPPYYDAVPYADLADFFYVWLKRSVGDMHPALFREPMTPKDGEIVQLSERNPIYSRKTRQYFESLMKDAMAEGRRVLAPNGVGIIVFAHKTTAGWETQLQAMIDAGWVVTASWPIDTERPGRLRANNSAALASSVHLVCRPRENSDGSVRIDETGDWREVLAELPRRIHDWMPRLAGEGVVGADAIFACLGPALEVFSRYSRVEKASGDIVTLTEFLVEVWAAVSREALSMVFEGADASGFEEDARLTAMWLWTLQASDSKPAEEEEAEEEGADAGRASGPSGYSMEYDAARKIAQGLGAHLESLGHLVDVNGDIATLLTAGARTKYLFSGKSAAAPQPRRSKKPQIMLDLGDEAEAIEEARGFAGELSGRPGLTVLDRVHQAMILFGAGRGEAVKRFLVDEGVGGNPQFWRLAQALLALYPAGSDEKRWVEGVLARKKGLGF